MEAEEFLRQAIAHDPGGAKAHFELGQCYLKQHKPEAAEDEYRQALALDEKLIRAHYGLGQALLALGRTEEARREFHLHSELLARRRNSQSGISGSHD